MPVVVFGKRLLLIVVVDVHQEGDVIKSER